MGRDYSTCEICDEALDTENLRDVHIYKVKDEKYEWIGEFCICTEKDYCLDELEKNMCIREFENKDYENKSVKQLIDNYEIEEDGFNYVILKPFKYYKKKQVTLKVD